MKCSQQPIGHNKFSNTPNQIAEYLNFREPNLYTGRSFRCTSVTILADSGCNRTTLKRHGGWKSATVAEDFIEEFIENKKIIGETMMKSINSTGVSIDQPTTSSDFSTFKGASTSVSDSIFCFNKL